MSTKLLPCTLSALLLSTTAMAEVPSVAVDIAPVHSLVARVMDGVGTPDLVIPAGASPHGYSLRPSEAAALQNADLVFWLGEDLTPWLEDGLETLAEGATITTLLELDETELLDFREGASFEAHDHDHDDDHAHDEEHAHDDDHAHDEEHAHDDHGHDEDHAHDNGHKGHDHGEHDPHAWLSPDNASAWLNVIAARLSAADPDNAGAYFANAAAGRAEFEALKAEVNELLEPARGQRFVVFHDGYQYFETAFDLFASGAISLGDATDPSPARIAEIQDRVRDENVACVLAEPQFNPGIVAVVLDGTDAGTAVVDPLGSDLAPGPALYPQLLRNLATNLASCF